jgi:5'-nucleotidase
VLVIHQGGFQAGTPTLNGCAGNLAGTDIERIAERLDPSIKVIVSAHTHGEYNCTITTSDGTTRLITSAASFGRVLTDITLTIADKTGQLTAMAAQNSIVQNSSNPRTSSSDVPLLDLPKDAQVNAVVQQYVTASAPLANRIIGTVSEDILNRPNALGESASGDVIADAQLQATQPAALGGAQIAFMNPGGIRGGDTFGFLFAPSAGEAPGEVTYGEAFTVQPFGNSLVTKTMTGAQLHLLLEQQFAGCGADDDEDPADLGRVHVHAVGVRPGLRRQGRRPHAERHDGRPGHHVPGHDEQLPRHRRRRLHHLRQRDRRPRRGPGHRRPGRLLRLVRRQPHPQPAGEPHHRGLRGRRP